LDADIFTHARIGGYIHIICWLQDNDCPEDDEQDDDNEDEDEDADEDADEDEDDYDY